MGEKRSQSDVGVAVPLRVLAKADLEVGRSLIQSGLVAYPKEVAERVRDGGLEYLADRPSSEMLQQRAYQKPDFLAPRPDEQLYD